MTNGEKLIEAFPSIGLYKKAHDGIQINFNSVWFNAEYKEPTTKNDLGDEYISRSELMAILSDYYDTTVEYRSMLKEIAALHSVTSQPRKGYWVYTPQRRIVDETDDGCVYETDYRCSCSECGGDFGFARVEDSFCKYCGADMREDKE